VAARVDTCDTRLRLDAAAQTALPHNIPDFSQDTSRPTVRSARSGDWSDPATWQEAALPTAGHVVHVDPGHTVTIRRHLSGGLHHRRALARSAFDPQVDTRLTVTNLM